MSEQERSFKKKMTLKQFMAEFRKIRGRYNFEWKDRGLVGPYYRGLMKDRNVCPITAVCYEKTATYYATYNFDDAAKKLKLKRSTAFKIQKAADSSKQTWRELR